MASQTDYDHGRACGRGDYRAGRSCDARSSSQMWSTGYADGWAAAQDEAIARHGHALAVSLSWGEGVEAFERRLSSAVQS